MSWNAGRVLRAVSSYFPFDKHWTMPEWEIDGGRADLAVITKSGYLTEIEVKTSISDWKADSKKDKWRRARPHVSRFFYAVPERLIADGIPAFVPPQAGILVVRELNQNQIWNDRRDICLELRTAVRVKSQKISPEMLAAFHETAYWRYWRSLSKLEAYARDLQASADRNQELREEIRALELQLSSEEHLERMLRR